MMHHAISFAIRTKNGDIRKWLEMWKIVKILSCQRKTWQSWAVKRNRVSSGNGDDTSVASPVRQGGFTIMYYANPGTLRPA